MSRLLSLSLPVITTIRIIAFSVAVGAVVLSYAGSRYAWLDYQPGGASFDSQIRPAFTLLFAIAIVVALKWEIVGGAVAGFAAAALVAFATQQLVATHAVAVVAVFAVPAALWVAIDLHDQAPRKAMFAIALVVVSCALGFVVGQAIYDHYLGPTHPASTVVPLPDSQLEWIWAGSVTSNEAEIRTKPADGFESVRLAVSAEPTFADPTWVAPQDIAGQVIGFDLAGLTPDTAYHYAVEVDGTLDLVRQGQFQTFPVGPASFTIAVGACARVGSNGRIFDTIREHDPLFYLIAGDMHYADNRRNVLGRYVEVMDLTLAMPAQSALYRSTAVAYMWDDHDYGGNDADGSSSSRQAAMAAYREYVPSYELSGDESAIYQAFTVGRVRFLLTDARSARDLDNDDQTTSMLGFEQKAWLKEQLLEATQTAELIVWMNPVPWVAAEERGADHWGGYAEERRELADFIADNDIENLLMISGDAHMVAIDDGTNTDYTTNGGAGFPLLHSAPLDRRGSVKGGPYSHGAIAEGGQFATVDFDDDGEQIHVTLSARDWSDEELLHYSFTTE